MDQSTIIKLEASIVIVFEPSRWEEPVIQNVMLCELEIKLDNQESWMKIATWKYSLQPDTWSELVEVGKVLTLLRHT